VYYFKKNKISGARSTHKGEDACIQQFGVEPAGKRQLGRLRPRWDGKSKMDF
jgi:hypothetical protein